MIKNLLFSVLPVLMSIASYGQVFVIENDSLFCYTDAEIRKIATKFADGDECDELLRVSYQKELTYVTLIDSHSSIEASLMDEIALKDQIISLHIADNKLLISELKKMKRKNRLIYIGAGAVGCLLILNSYGK